MRENLIRSHATSMLVCVPAFCLSVWIMETYIPWPSPALVMTGVMGVAAVNFLLIVALERWRSRLGTLTLPALLGAVGIVMLFMIAQGVNRFYMDFGYGWLLPAVVFYMMLSSVAIFRERFVALKCYLALNAVALSVLWGLGAADKVALPF